MTLFVLTFWTILSLAHAGETPANAQLQGGTEPWQVRLSLVLSYDEASSSERWVFVATREWESKGYGEDAPPVHISAPMAVLPDLGGLKRYVSLLPRGSTIVWARSCLGPFDTEHPLSSEAKIEEFEAVCRQRGLTCRILPAG